MKKVVKILPLWLLSKVEDHILNDYQRTKRFLTESDPELLQAISERKAIKIFRKAARRVPAYKKFLKRHKLKPRKIINIDFFDIVPATDKKNYVKKYSYEERCLDGKFPKAGNIDESSGSSGTPTNWIRSVKEEKKLLKQIKFAFRYMLGDEQLVVLSCWSSGPWATGVKFCELVENFALVKNLGTSIPDVTKTLKTFGKKYHYLIAGYPQFLKEMVEQKFPWKDFKIDIITGGDGTVYGWHDHIRTHIQGKHESKIISAYGSSDIDIGVAFETDTSQIIRKACAENNKLNREIFKRKQVPMLFQYNPTAYYVKNKGREFTITALDKNIASPKIKYNVHDEGGAVTYKRMQHILQRYGIELPKESLKMPFLFIIGRSDGTISLDGANVYPQQVMRSIYSDDVLTTKTNNYCIEKYTDKQHNIHFVVHVEIKKGHRRDAKLRQRYARIIHKKLLKLNADYEESYNNNKRIKPKIQLYAMDKGPFGDMKIKNKLIL